MCITNVSLSLEQSCPQNGVTSATISTTPQKQINGYKWMRQIDNKDTEVKTARLKGKVKISLDTKNMTDVNEISVIILDSVDNQELSTIKITKKIMLSFLKR